MTNKTILIIPFWHLTFNRATLSIARTHPNQVLKGLLKEAGDEQLFESVSEDREQSSERGPC